MKPVSGKSAVRFLGCLRAWLPGMRTRFLVLVAGLFLILAGVMTTVASYLDLRDEEKRALADTETVGRTVGRLAVPHLINHHYLILEKELESISSGGLVLQVQVYDPQRSIVVDGDPKTSYFDEIPIHPSIMKTLQTANPVVIQTWEEISLALPVRNSADEPVLGAAVVVLARSSPEGLLWSIWQRNTLIVGVLLVFCIPVTLSIGTSFVRPIKALTETAHSVSAGDFDARFPVERKDEIGVLARAYRDMVATIRDNMIRIHELAFVDSVTRLSNREAFRRQFIANKNQAGSDCCPYAVIYIDLDRFKRVNDSYGHDCGDLLLKEIAARFDKAVSCHTGGSGVPCSSETASSSSMSCAPSLARLGGDEFAVLVPGHRNIASIKSLCDDIICAVEQPFIVDGLTMTVGASIGVARSPEDGTEFTELMRHADIAMYAAKRGGGNRACFYTYIDNDPQTRERIRLEAELKTALNEDQLTVHFQPKVEGDTQYVVGAEALARWNNPRLGLLAPGTFIDLAEETGLISKLGDQILKLACAQGKVWIDAGRPVPLAVNVSVRQFDDPGFTARVLDILEGTGFPPSMLQLEVTETVAMAHPSQIKEMTAPLRDAGITFAIDDFGTGYSSLAQLQSLPFDTFKIDRGFTSRLSHDPHSRAIIQTILAMARNLNYEVVAEGVETVDQYRILCAEGCTIMQGYLFAKPMPADAFESWIISHTDSGNKVPAEPLSADDREPKDRMLPVAAA